MSANGDQKELAAEALEESLADLYENAPCGYISTFLDGTFAKVNGTFLAWTKYQREELLVGKRFQDLLTLAGKIFYETHYAPLLQMQGFVHEIAFDLICSDGRHLPVFVNSVQKRDGQGKPLLNRITLFDASDRREYERELQLARKKAEEALRLRDYFLSLAAHELKTPLTSVLGNIHLLQRRVNREATLGTRDQRTLQIIADQAGRLHKMIQSLLDISRIETGQLSIERASVDLCVLVSRLVDEVQSVSSERKIELHCSIQSAVIQGDELRLEQVFQNLIQNALKYSAPTTRVSVSITHRQSYVDVEVQDTGIGIPPEALPQLFKRFYRASNVQESSVSGLGIGLYVVKEIVELHSGHINVQSTQGRGSTFTVSFPIASS